jgi:hypothetical protein
MTSKRLVIFKSLSQVMQDHKWRSYPPLYAPHIASPSVGASASAVQCLNGLYFMYRLGTVRTHVTRKKGILLSLRILITSPAEERLSMDTCGALRKVGTVLGGNEMVLGFLRQLKFKFIFRVALLPNLNRASRFASCLIPAIPNSSPSSPPESIFFSLFCSAFCLIIDQHIPLFILHVPL